MNTKEKILGILKNDFNVSKLKVDDLSFQHRKHKEALESGGGHYHVFIVSDIFEGKTLLKRHKLINKSILEQLGQEVHALGIKALTPEEFAKKKHTQ